MINIFKSIEQKIDNLVKLFIVIFFSLLIFSCSLQVFTRYVLNSAFSWTEELARYSFIWANLLGATICSKKGTHATVTALTDKFNKNLSLKIEYLVQSIILIISIVMVIYGSKLTFRTIGQTSAAMKISMAFINASIPICGFFIFIYSIGNFINLSQKKLGDAK